MRDAAARRFGFRQQRGLLGWRAAEHDAGVQAIGGRCQPGGSRRATVTTVARHLLRRSRMGAVTIAIVTLPQHFGGV
ncbi:hypothetical protein [Nitratireductor indicus]|uniref:hypothetical protein n=1 Tax=Nitratireductor indicus TaxID=721133 RepID=UPI0028747007|nr:hypothetical protein [Nitratireductor indicus]MDS1136741.1 hypothetical protein [Nitratireductor indicus]